MIILKTLFITLTFLSLSVKAEDPFLAKSIQQYIETCQGALDCLAKISPELSHLGRDVDKTLSFYKNLALKACELNKLEFIDPFNIKEGKHDEFSPILGIKSDSMKLYEEFAQKNPEFIRFGNSLYHQNSNCPGEQSGNDLLSTSMTMLPANLKKIVDNSSQQELNSYIEKYGLPPSQIVGESDFRAGVTRIYYTDNEWNNWTTHITIDPQGAYDERFDAYIPPQVISLHE